MVDSTMDWNELASSQIPSLSDDTMVSSQWTQAYSNTTMMSNNTSSAQSFYNSQHPQQNINPYQPGLFSMTSTESKMNQWSRDPATLKDVSLTHKEATSNDTVKRKPLETLEQMMARREEEIISSIITKTVEDTQRSVDELLKSQLQASWERERAKWYREVVGTRRLGGATTSYGNASNSVSTSNALVTVPEAQSTQNLIGTPNKSTDGKLIIHSVETFDVAMAKEHLNALKELLPAVLSEQKGSLRLLEAVERFHRIVMEQHSGQYIQQATHSAYSATLQFLMELVKLTSNDRPVEQAKAALIHLCKQFRNHISSVVRNSYEVERRANSSDGLTPYISSVANMCSIFAKLNSGLLRTDEYNIWAVTYYCLRCGDAVAASEVLQSQQSLSLSSDAPVVRIVYSLAQAQRREDCIWMTSVPLLSADDLLAIDNLFETAKRQETSDIYRNGVYSFLARTGSPETSETVTGFRTIEDYLTAYLTKALFQSNPIDELSQLGNMISDEFGLNYFHDTSSGGWSFALPLFLTQQYHKALTHLVEAGGPMGLLYATHIALILSNAGVPLRNLGKKDISDFPDENVLSLLISSYAYLLLSTPFGFRSTDALEYLVRIPFASRRQKEVAKLIATTSDIDNLVGTLNADGMRQNSFLANYFRSSEIKFILGEAASILSGEKGNQQKTSNAIMCLMLGERYGDVLSILNQLLSPPNKRDQHRNFWIEQTERFHAQFLTKRTHVSDMLARTGNDRVLRTNRLLLDLNKFEALRSSKLYDDAMKLAETLQLLPTSQEDLGAKQHFYYDLDDLIKEALPSFLTGVMEILHKNYLYLKQQVHSENPSVVREQLHRLREQSRLIATIAASAGLPSEQIGNLTTLSILIV